MINSIPQRTLFILQVLHEREGQTVDSYDALLLEKFDISPKQLGRLLDDVAEAVDSIEVIKVGRKKSYKLIRPLDIFTKIVENSHEIGWLFNMAHEADPDLFRELEKYTSDNKHVYQFKNTPFEDTKSLEDKETFKRLKDAVEHREYRKITFKGSVEDNLKCLKMIYMENNWYIAYVNSDNKLLFGRISFIQRVDYASNVGKFHPSSVQDHLAFLKNIQNSMTLYGKDKKIAKIKARPDIAKYFDEGMKLRLSSQKFVEKLEDGSVIFTLEYTQPIEILPLIQSWMPNLVILEPKGLEKKYIQILEKTMQTYKNTPST
ncbi:MAG: WYL domain-containing protein [Flavobacteriaceae bacterium]|nr:WYL domain-containing protein [Flavobacteriaceae bacterium]